jgi:hypothetical protein
MVTRRARAVSAFGVPLRSNRSRRAPRLRFPSLPPKAGSANAAQLDHPGKVRELAMRGRTQPPMLDRRPVVYAARYRCVIDFYLASDGGRLVDE